MPEMKRSPRADARGVISIQVEEAAPPALASEFIEIKTKFLILVANLTRIYDR
jgi:hypothetical protein